MIDSETAQAKMEARAAALPSHPDYPLDTRAHAHASMLKLCQDFIRGGMPALAFGANYDKIRTAIKQYEAIDWWSQLYEKRNMPDQIFKYSIAGTAANEQTWSMQGTVECSFSNAHDMVMNQTFEALTDGKAVYGKPGQGCQGPYQITHFHIDAVEENSK